MSERLVHLGQMPAESLSDFIARRRLELDALEAPLMEKIDAIRSEREQLKRAALAAGIETYADPGQERTRSSRRLGKMTIKEAVVAVLEDNNNGLAALDLLKQINERFSTDYARESLSPQLSRLKQADYIRLTGRIWHLPAQTPKEIETPDHNLFEERGPEVSKSESHAKDREASSGGGG